MNVISRLDDASLINSLKTGRAKSSGNEYLKLHVIGFCVSEERRGEARKEGITEGRKEGRRKKGREVKREEEKKEGGWKKGGGKKEGRRKKRLKAKRKKGKKEGGEKGRKEEWKE